jgi:hypothetical protein
MNWHVFGYGGPVMMKDDPTVWFIGSETRISRSAGFGRRVPLQSNGGGKLQAGCLKPHAVMDSNRSCGLLPVPNGAVDFEQGAAEVVRPADEKAHVTRQSANQGHLMDYGGSAAP